MLFTTLRFAEFFAVAFGVSWALARAKSPWPRLILLLAMSYAFYAAWDWRYLPLIFGSSTVDFFLARAIAKKSDPIAKKRLLLVTVVLNLGFLGFFKYADFVLENVHVLTELAKHQTLPEREALKLLPPVGISFFTFESMSYVIDVYRGDLEAHHSYPRYLLFVAFFPHLVAGPIVRPRDLLPQFERAPHLTREEAGEAFFLIATGLLKKVVLADQLSLHLVDRVFERPTSFSALEVAAAVYGYALQIYCDFSGYSDIAIGCALLLGVRFPKNFDAPYQATDLADFWRRWHISLSTWLRDYLYIPLGGNRGSELATYRNLLLTMLLGGLWHGPAWRFALWGLLHGVGLAATRAFQRRPGASREKPGKLSRFVTTWLTFHYVAFAWIFFRAPSMRAALDVLKQLGTLTTFHPNLPPIVIALLWIGLNAVMFPRSALEWLKQRFIALPAPAQGLALFLVALVLHEAAATVAVPFVYFQF